MQVAKQGKFNGAEVFVLIFFLSGAAGLAYQMVWAKAFVATIGSEFPTVLAVVTAFMAGMAIGNLFLLNCRTIRQKLYGFLELIIGVWGAVTVLSIPLSEPIVLRILGPTPAPAFQWAVVFTTVMLCLLPATAAMGATLAAAERFLSTRIQSHSAGILYGANTVGAALGAILAAFWLMPALGIRGSLLCFAGVNIVCGFAALQVVRQAAPAESFEIKESGTGSKVGTKLFAAGVLGIGLEVVVIRALSHVLENTVYTFAVVLAVYLIGNAIGALIAQKRIAPRFQRVDLVFASLAITSVGVGVSLRWSAGLYRHLRDSLGDSIAAVALAELLIAALYFLSPTILMGISWTLLAQHSLQRKGSLAWAVALNTAGAAMGTAFFGLLAIPVAGLKGALAIFPIGYAFLTGRKKFALPILIVSALAIPLLTSAPNLINLDGLRLVSKDEGVMGSVSVLEEKSGARVLKFNNRFQMGGTAARVAEERQAAIPLLLHDNPKSALFIGLGTGITFAAARNFPTVQADGVELVPEIARMMPMFNEEHAFESPNLRTHIADGRRFVRATEQKYDVIVSDLFHPAQEGAGFLYTHEHFNAIRARLAQGGLFVQWLPVYQMDLRTIHIVMATFAEIFPQNEVWLLRLNVDTPVIGLLGRLERSSYSADALENRTRNNPDLAAFLKRLRLGDSVNLMGNYIGHIKVPPRTRINTDWNPILLFDAPHVTFQRRDFPGKRLLTLIEELQSDPSAILANVKSEKKLSDFVEARNIYLRGLQLEIEGEAGKAVAAYIESARISPDFTAGYAQAITIATGLTREQPQQSKAILARLAEVRPEIPVAAELLRRLTE